MINIRCETLLDYSRIREVNTLAFNQINEAKLVEEIRNSQHYIPKLSLVAESHSNIVGHILFSYIDLVSEEKFRVLGLAPVAVDPQFQRQHIGSALVQAGLEKADVMGEPIVVVLGHPSFYNRFGFVPSINYGIESPFEVPADFFMVKPLSNYKPEYKGKIVYPRAFQQV